MKKIIYLVRHGDKEKIPGDPPLSDIGLDQASKTASYFEKLPVSSIFASPILRTQQTAKFIADLLGMKYQIEDLLKERVNWGDDPNQKFEYFLDMWNKSNMDRDWQPPVGDSSRKSGERLKQAIFKLIKNTNNDSHIILVTHGGITTDFLRNVFDINELNKFISDFETTLDNNIKECSITTLEVDEKLSSIKLLDLAYINHLN